MRQKPPNDLVDVGRKEDGKMPTCETAALHSNCGHRVIEVKLIEISRLTVVAAIATMLAATVEGSTVQTFGQWSAIDTVDRELHFNDLDFAHNGTSLSDYMEDSVFVRLSGDSFSGFGPGVTPVFDPFHTGVDPATAGFYFPNGGSDEWLTVEPLTEPKIYALEFLYGNGWTTGDINGVPWGNNDAYLEWRTFLDGNMVSSGMVGPNPQLAVGTVIGFYDFIGFDQIQLRCKIDSSFDPNLQAIALDDMYVQYTSVPEPATLATLGLGALFLRRRERTKTE